MAGEIERTIRSNAGVASGGAGLNLLDQDLTVEELSAARAAAPRPWRVRGRRPIMEPSGRAARRVRR